MVFFDGHTDIMDQVTDRIMAGEKDILRNYHLEKFRTGGCEGGIFVLWAREPHVRRTEELMRCVAEEIKTAEDFRLVYSYEDIQSARQDGKIYVLLGLEGMAAMGSDISWVDRYYEFGCRHGMLTWNEVNELGAGAVSGEVSGLTDAGRAAVRRMQELGMIVDVSHLNAAGFWDIMDITEQPVIASHSNCHSLCPVPRNLTDDQMRAIRDTGGVVGLNSYAPFIAAAEEDRTLERFADHACHMIDVMGIDHVGFGMDFMDFLSDFPSDPATASGYTVEGLRDVTQMQNLIDALRRRGLDEEELQKICTGNYMRVIKEILV